MPNSPIHPNRFTRYLYAMLAVVLMLGLAFVVLLLEQARYQEAVEQRRLSLNLAEELRQSSADLARMMRSYVITGERRYLDHFDSVVAIRDGLQPRPAHYNLAYWELKAIEGNDAQSAHEELGERIALIELMRRTGFTERELSKLIEAKRYSDELVEIERAAMQLADSEPRQPHNRDRALTTLADRHFITLKAKVLRPIIEAQQMIITRTQNSVDMAQQRLSIATLFLFVMCGTLLALILLLGREIRRLLGCSMQDLQNTLNRLGHGDFLTPIKAQDNNSVLGWIARTQRQLASLNLMHFKALVESSDDAIISKSTESIVASWNAGAERMFGYSAEEMIGTSIRRLIPEERAFEEDEILEKITRGEKVEHFQTQRLHRDGHLIDISVTISPIYNEDGRIIGASKIARDISSAKAAQAEIHQLAFYDTLTGLANRRLLIERLTQAIDRYSRDQASFAVLFLDLDNFKRLNDTLGHEAGDALLEEVGKRLLDTLRKTDTAARLGGDEFVLLVNLHQSYICDNQWLLSVVEKVKTRIAAPYSIHGTSHSCTTSIGGVIYAGQDCTAMELLSQADHAMYQAKRQGKNQFHLYDGE
ncbi:diguanylate cyclase [Pseudomonas sp. GOM7]|uniref:diguanylate cyclase domain-containing protein n=1 Tax=Pseudomonas sp. GOM7 TaxID=2998079 RepID=UPI00227C9613|nr:diguanylate cyclase [Pseudomonas sp. GOM7]WAJ36343.1 diguanylate cyclase [Pseudomonas sp. GOM7]